MKHIVLADLHGWDFVTEYKQIPLAEDESDDKGIRKVLKDVSVQRDRKKAEKVKKANKFKLDSRRPSSTRYSNAVSTFPSMSTCFLCGKPGHFWRSCYSSRNSTNTASNAGGYTWQRLLAQLPQQPTIMPSIHQGSK
jgi:hypothetical protein